MISEPEFYGCIRTINSRKEQLLASVNKLKENLNSYFQSDGHPQLKQVFEVNHDVQSKKLHISSKVLNVFPEPQDKLVIHDLVPLWKFSYQLEKNKNKINVLEFYLSVHGNVSLDPKGEVNLGFYDQANLFEDIILKLFNNLIDNKLITAIE